MYAHMKVMIDSSLEVRDLMGQLMSEQMRRVTGNYIREREKARGKALSEAQIICWKNEVLFLSAKTQFPADRVEIDDSIFQSQIHLWEDPRQVDDSDRFTLSSKTVKDIDDIVSIGSVFVFYLHNGVDECLTGNIYCRRWKAWDKIKSDDLIILYASASYPSGDVDNLEEPIQYYLKMNAFLYSPYAFAEPRKITRKKRGLKPNKRQEKTNVVVLRKTPKKPPQFGPGEQMASQFYPEMLEADEEEFRRKITVRFQVTGHWRNQWYPSEGAHKRIWISPYHKGPLDGLFVAKVRVFKAVR